MKQKSEKTKQFIAKDAENGETIMRKESQEQSKPFTTNVRTMEEAKEPQERSKPFTTNVRAMEEADRTQELKHPFTTNVGTREEANKPQERIKPFTIDVRKNEEVKAQKNIVQVLKPQYSATKKVSQTVSQENKTVISNEVKRTEEGEKEGKSKELVDKDKWKESPFSYISPDICNLAKEMLPEDSSFVPYLAKCIYSYIKSGGNIADIQMVDKNQKNQKNSDFNFKLSLKKQVTTVWDTQDGETCDLSYGVEVQVTLKSGYTKVFDAVVEHSKIKAITWLTEATHSLADIPKGKDGKILYENMVQNCIEQEVEEERIYPNAGWRKIPRIGWRYVYKNGIIGGTENVHTKGKNYDLDVRAKYVGTRAMFDKVICMKDICKNGRTSLELLLFVHAGVLTTLFELAGHQLDFSLMVVAPTNSRKTSMVTAMGKIFDRTELKADAEFATATNAGIEKVLGTYKDAPVIIDDFKPGANLAEQREMDRKFDEVLRFFGDRVSKKRMTDFVPNADKIYFPVGGNCIITGEYPPNAIESSLTRLFLTEITSEDVRNDVLAIYQKEKWILPTHMYDFLTWVTERFDICVDIIQQVYISSRSKYTFRVGRFAGMYSTMMCVAKILCLYAEQRAFWSGEESQEFCENVERAVTLELNIMEDRLKRRDKATKVLDIFKTEIETGQIVAVRLNEETCKDRELLYEDDNFYYISTMYLRQIVERRSKDIPDMPPVINSEEMILLLDRKGAIAVLEKDGKRIKSRKLPIQRGNAKRYLYIKKNILNNLEEL